MAGYEKKLMYKYMKTIKQNILISGSLVYDRIMDFPGLFKDQIMPDKIHILNVGFLVNEVKESFGGTGGNIAYNLSLLNERSTLLTTVGKDFGLYKKWLISCKVNLAEVVMIKEQNTASVYIITDQSDNQIAAFNPGAMSQPRGEFRETLLRQALAIISPGNAADMLNYAKRYKQQKVKYIFDPGQQIGALKPMVLKTCISGAEILIGNDYEIELIRRKLDWTASQLLDKVKILIITQGVRGSELYMAGQKTMIKAVKVKKALDPTGAGDAYRAGLIKGLVNELTLETSAKLASTVAAFAVECQGTQRHHFTTVQLAKRFQETYKETLIIQ